MEEERWREGEGEGEREREGEGRTNKYAKVLNICIPWYRRDMLVGYIGGEFGSGRERGK